MNSQGVLNFCLAEDFSNSNNLEETLRILLDTLECMQDNKTVLCYAMEIYNQMISNTSFSNWLYDFNTQPELSTFKKELSKRMNRSNVISLEDYNKLSHNIDQENCEDKLLMSACCRTNNILYVSSPIRYWEAKQWYLARYVRHQDFYSAIIECFPNLYFHERVAASLNTLNADFTTERPYIVQHLAALNNFKPHFDALVCAGAGYRRLCSEFYTFSQIECSPQSDRQAAQRLNYNFIDSNGRETFVCCELHTKLKWRNMDHSNQDRIYFHPGKPEIADGKILIAHIGTHL